MKIILAASPAPEAPRYSRAVELLWMSPVPGAAPLPKLNLLPNSEELQEPLGLAAERDRPALPSAGCASRDGNQGMQEERNAGDGNEGMQEERNAGWDVGCRTARDGQDLRQPWVTVTRALAPPW